jgi:hypothetical protein
VADSGQTAVLSYYPDAASAPVVVSARLVINDTAPHATLGAWTVPLSDGARITYVQAQFAMTDGATAGQATIVVLWNDPFSDSSPCTR